MFKVTTNFLRHSGGTKFYETVLIHDENGDHAMLIKRWGKIADAYGRGQTKVERGNLNAMLNSTNKILDEKRKRKSDGGRYEDSILEYGFHTAGGRLLPSSLKKRSNHYNDVVVQKAIEEYFGLSAEEAEYVQEPMKAKKEELEPARGGSWGSW